MSDYSLTDQELIDLEVLHRELTDKRQADRVKRPYCSMLAGDLLK